MVITLLETMLSQPTTMVLGKCFEILFLCLFDCLFDFVAFFLIFAVLITFLCRKAGHFLWRRLCRGKISVCVRVYGRVWMRVPVCVCVCVTYSFF